MSTVIAPTKSGAGRPRANSYAAGLAAAMVAVLTMGAGSSGSSHARRNVRE